MSKRTLYVISYDISNDKSRNKVSDFLQNYGYRVQKSVFECRLEQKSLKKLSGILQNHIDQETDSILIYLMCENCVKQKTSIGLEVTVNDEDFLVL